MSPRTPRPSVLATAAVIGGLTLGLISVAPATAAVSASVPVAATAVLPLPASAPAAVAETGVLPRPAVVVEPPAADAAAAQWSVVPADAAGPDGRISLRHSIDPGASVTDAIAVSNLGSEPATFVVAAGDGIVGADGAFDIAAGDPQDSGTWITVEGLQDGSVSMAPGETRILPVRIDVPAGVTPGDHPAGIVVGVSRDDDGVTVTNRVGVRAHLQVTGEITPALAIDGVRASFEPSWIPFAPGTLRIETTVVNSGNVRLGAFAGVAGTGIASASLAGEPAELLPGDSATVVAETSAWPVLALSGAVEVRAVALGDDTVQVPEPTAREFMTAAPSWTGLALLVLVVGAVVSLIVARPRTGGSDAAAPTATSPQTAEEGLASTERGRAGEPVDAGAR